MSDRYLVDTNVLIASFSPDHPHHRAARSYLAALAAQGDVPCVAGHSLVEAYAVLTRLPRSVRLSPDAASELIGAFARAATIVTLTSQQYADAVQSLGRTGIAGGLAYDALIIETAISAGVDEVITFNLRHFERLARGRITVSSPPQ